jgi:Rrf2 family protein
MKLNRSVWYAFYAASYIARQEDGVPVMAKDIAESFRIPLEYLLKILHQLVRSDVLCSIRGPRGGFYLSRPAREITLLQIFEAIEGPLENISDITSPKVHADMVRKLSEIYRQAVSGAAKIFSKTTLVDLITSPTDKKS